MGSQSWRQPFQYFFLALLLVTIIWFVSVARPLIGALVIAALFAYVLHPLVNLIMRRTRLGHTMAVNITYLIFLSLLIAIPAILTPIVIRQVGGTLDFDNILTNVRNLTNQTLIIGDFAIPLDTAFSNVEELLTQTITFILNSGFSTLADVSTNFLWILVILVSIYYLLKDSHQFINALVNLFQAPYQRHVRKLVAEIDDIWGNFLRGQLVLMIIVGILSWLGSVAVGLPGAFTIGLVAGILDLIPSLGPTLAAILAITIAWLEGSTYLPVSNFFFGIIVLVIFLAVQQIENIWIRPALMGRRLRLHPALVFVGVFGSLALFGILTTLIIIPVMSSIGVLGRYLLYRIRGIDPYPEEDESITVEKVETAETNPDHRPAPEPDILEQVPE